MEVWFLIEDLDGWQHHPYTCRKSKPENGSTRVLPTKLLPADQLIFIGVTRKCDSHETNKNKK
jgi:hypothetical protein